MKSDGCLDMTVPELIELYERSSRRLATLAAMGVSGGPVWLDHRKALFLALGEMVHRDRIGEVGATVWHGWVLEQARRPQLL